MTSAPLTACDNGATYGAAEKDAEGTAVGLDAVEILEVAMGSIIKKG
jgi:hypothetical protein